MILFINRYFQQLFQNWKHASQSVMFKIMFLGTTLLFLPFIYFLPDFFKFLEQRSGGVLEDPILISLPSIDVSYPIFFIVYFSVIFVILYTIRFPWLFIRGCQSFLTVHYIRNFCLFVTPLNPPIDIIILQDPFLQLFIYNKDLPNTKDLFFSGHTTTVFMFMLLLWNKFKLRLFFGGITMIMAILLLLQHCHYTVDILAAVGFSYMAYRLVYGLWLKLKLPIY